MSWMDQINAGTAVWRGVEAYANERIAELTQVCVSTASTDQQIRCAQAGIEELRNLLAIPTRIQAAAQHRAQPSRTGY